MEQKLTDISPSSQLLVQLKPQNLSATNKNRKREGLTKISIVFLLGLQIAISLLLGGKKASFQNTPYPPTKLAIKALSLGDEQFLFRYFVFNLQNAGDRLGNVVALKNHSYQRLYGWFIALDDFDPNSKIIPSIAANYYGASSNGEGTEWVIKYLIENGTKNISSNWRSLTYAAFLAKNIGNYNLITQATAPLIASQDAKIPLWAKTIGLFYLQNDIDETFNTLSTAQQQQIICNSWKFLQTLESEIMTQKTQQTNIEKDPIFASIIYARIQKVKSHSRYLKNCD